MSEVSRRALIAGATAAAGSGLFGINELRAQSYASSDVHFISAFAAGAGGDVTVRFFAEKMRPMLGRNVIVDNKVGAGGNIATEYVARSKPDGHTIYLMSIALIAANQHVLMKPTVDLEKELQVFGTISRTPYLIVVPNNSPYQSIVEFTEAVKNKGEKASYGLAGGGAFRVTGEMYKAKAGLRAVEVAYKSSAGFMNDLLSGAIDYAIADSGFALAQEKQGQLRILAASTPERMQSIPHVPTLMESGYPVSLIGWWGGLVPSGTPRPIVEQLNRMLSEVVSSDDGKKFLDSISADPWIQTPDQGQSFMREEIKNWGDYVKIANLPKQ